MFALPVSLGIVGPKVYGWTSLTALGVRSWGCVDIANGGQKILAGDASASNSFAYISLDGGGSISVTFPNHRIYTDCRLQTTGTGLLITSKGSIVRSPDNGSTIYANAQLSNAACCDLTASGTVYGVYADDTNLYLRRLTVISSSLGTSVTHNKSGVTGITVSSSGSKAVLSSSSGVIYSSNIHTFPSTFSTSTGITGNISGVDGDLAGTILMASKNGGDIYESTDSGASFSVQSAWGSKAWLGCRMSDDASIIIAWTATQIFRSTDSGTTVSEITPAGAANIVKCGLSRDGLWVAIAMSGATYIQIKSF